MSSAAPRSSLRLAVYTDYPYHRVGRGIYAERAFALFLARIGTMVERLVVIGRLHPGSGDARYPLGAGVELAGLPYYPSLARPLGAGLGMVRSLPALWRGLDDVDCVWLLGPHPLALVMVVLAVLRRRRVALGVRQDLPAYADHRHPGRPLMRLGARALDRAYRALARRLPTVVVGPDLAARYSRSPRLLETTVSLVAREDVVGAERAARRNYTGELTILSAGRIDPEKNPLLLADVLARLNTDEPRWRLVVCGEGSMQGELAERLAALGVADRAELAGYLSHERLSDLYRRSHVFLHVSWTEGLPQVLFEAFAAGVPVVATAVGGIPGRVGRAVRLIPPGSAEAAHRAVEEVAGDPALRTRLVEAGRSIVAENTLERRCAEVVAFLEGGGPRRTGGRIGSGPGEKEEAQAGPNTALADGKGPSRGGAR